MTLNTTISNHTAGEETHLLRRQNSDGSQLTTLSQTLLENVKFETPLEISGGSATLTSSIIAISKNLLGAGVLSMSGGIALYADSPRAVVSASLWIVVQAAIFGYFAILIAKVCRYTDSRTIRECWERTMGHKYAAAVVFIIGLNPFQGTLAYSAILSQTFQSLCATMDIRLSYVTSLMFVTIVALLPLCLMKNIHALAPFSFLGTLAVLLTVIGMCIRCLDGTYLPGGKFYDDLDASWQPAFGTTNRPWSLHILPLIAMIYESFVMHYNSPRFYMELRHRSIPRYTKAVIGSFGLSTIIYIAITSAGFLTFGASSDSYILNNYSPLDPIASCCRLLIMISVLTIYPIAFIGFRDAVLDVLKIPAEHQTTTYLNLLTIGMLAFITLIATFVTDLGLINALGGGSVACAMMSIFPFFMFRKAIQDLGTTAVREQIMEVYIALLLMIVAVILGVGGVAMELSMGVA